MANLKRVTVLCPECKTEIVVDGNTGQVLRHSPHPADVKGGKDLEQLMAAMDESKKRAAQIFDQEITNIEDKDRILEEKFQDALEKSRSSDGEDEKPIFKPWDFD